MGGVVRLGLLGGTFDPPHYGHLIAAQESQWRLNLDRVLFLPASRNPLKRDEPTSAAEHRIRMVELAISGAETFELSREDLERPAPSYTVDLLRLLGQQHGASVELFFLAGADLLPELPSWHRPAEVLALATLVVVTRPGWPEPDLAALERDFPSARDRACVLSTPGVGISSSEIRERVRLGQPVRYLTPPAVADYIRTRGLYGNRQE